LLLTKRSSVDLAQNNKQLDQTGQKEQLLEPSILIMTQLTPEPTSTVATKPTTTIAQTPPKPSGFLTDHQGKPSSMRLMSWVALLAAIGFGFLTLTKPTDESTGIYITFGFLISAFAPKAVQKFAENDLPPLK
jgi:hypothetical protein